MDEKTSHVVFTVFMWIMSEDSKGLVTDPAFPKWTQWKQYHYQMQYFKRIRSKQDLFISCILHYGSYLQMFG